MESKLSRFVEEIKPIIKEYKQKKKESGKLQNSYQKRKSYTTYSSENSENFKIGELVKHDVFGKGVIKNIDGKKATVIFENVGEKTLLKSFLKK
jgi:DNA helicase-2/ATP-dependent DNA helicase PcrA